MVLTCQAGCDRKDILDKLGITWLELFHAPRNGQSSARQDLDRYIYLDHDGEPRYRVVRGINSDGKKTFHQEAADGRGGYIRATGCMAGVPLTLYRLPAVEMATLIGETIWIAEGEKDVQALERAGVTATTNPCGVGKWRPEYTAEFNGDNVVIVADKDKPGYNHARHVARELRTVGCTVRTVEAATGKDAAEHLGAGLGLEDFVDVDLDAHDQADDTETDDVDERQVDPADPARFFRDKVGLLVQDLADEVRDHVELRRLVMHRDTDDSDALWHYQAGVWRPGGAKGAERACAQLLGQRLRLAHVSNLLLALRTGHLDHVSDQAPHPELINFPNTMVRWDTGGAVAHDPAAGSTVQLAAPWNPTADCPRFRAWLHQMLPNVDPDFMFEVLGYLMFNGNPFHKAFMLRGTGRNGKGTFLRIAKGIIGDRNCASVPLQTLSDNRFAAAELHMKLVNIAGDLDNRPIKDTSTFKMVTGQDPIFAERKYGQPFQFVAWGVPIFSANATPPSEDTSVGYMSRWIVIPFDVSLEGRTDPTVETEMMAELPGIARHAIDGIRGLMTRGSFDPPAEVKQATEDFAAEIDQVRAWVTDRCETDPDHWHPRTALHDNYKRWARANDMAPLEARLFYERLDSAGHRPARRAGGRGYVGIRPIDPSSDS